jgi:sulfate ABC transporter permease protein CysT
MAALQLEPGWKARIGDWFAREDMQQLARFLRQRKAAGATVYPPGKDIFAAFDATPFDAIKVVILGQDPYHGPGVAGIALTAIYAPTGWVGKLLAAYGIKIAYATPGIVLALVFIGLPFAVRTLQPVLEALGREPEEAAASLGANRVTTFRRVIVPELLPAWLTGFSLAFARGLGEYGSVIFIAGNLPYKTEIAPLLITIRLEEYDYNGAVAIAALLLVASFVSLLVINLLPLLFQRGGSHE